MIVASYDSYSIFPNLVMDKNFYHSGSACLLTMMNSLKRIFQKHKNIK